MRITMTGMRRTPSWGTLQEMIREALHESGKLTRINRKDGGVDYRALGTYELTFRTLHEDIPVELEIA